MVHRELTPGEQQLVDAIEVSEASDRPALVGRLQSAEALAAVSDIYNWDDGFAVPRAMADHPRCDLALALCLYWLAGGDWWDGKVEVTEINRENHVFSVEIRKRILEGHYPIGRLSFDGGFGRVAIYHFEKNGMPEVLYRPVVGTAPGPQWELSA